MASEQWHEKHYADEALKIIKAAEKDLLRNDFSLRLGDWVATKIPEPKNFKGGYALNGKPLETYDEPTFTAPITVATMAVGGLLGTRKIQNLLFSGNSIHKKEDKSP